MCVHVCVLAASFVLLLDIFTEQRVAGGREVDGDEAAAPPLTSRHRLSGFRGVGWFRWCARLRPVPAPASSAGSVIGSRIKLGRDLFQGW